jgi:hypothetical protein
VAEYTAQELLGIARANGFPEVTQRLIVDWVGRGLLDKPRRSGREAQKDLFLTLLRKQQEGVKRIATLANIPVGVWLYWGDSYVPLRQVRRALDTYTKAYRRGSWRAAITTAHQVLEQMNHPDATQADRDRMVRAVAESAFRGRLDDPSELVGKVRRVYDPGDSGERVGPAQHLPAAYVGLIEARLAAISELRSIPDALFEYARTVHRQSLGEYLRRQPNLARQPGLEKLMTRPDLEQLLNNACLDLTTVLGVLVLSGRKLATTGAS